MRLGHPVGAVVGGVVFVAALALVRPIFADPPQASGDLELYDAVPAESPVRVAAGEKRRFSIWVRGEGLRYQWMLDGGPVGDRRSWTFAPQETDVGTHLVTVAVDGPDGRGSWSWRVQVGLPAEEAPVTTTTEPPVLPSTAPPSTARPTTSSTSTSTGPPTTTTTSTRAPTTTRLPTTSSTSTSRQPTTSSTRQPTTSSTREPTTSSTRPPSTTSTERPTTTTSTLRPTTTTVPTARGRGVSEEDVRALFDRYEAAWRRHDIKELEAVGQVATQGQADALQTYFESVRDLEVDVTILSITPAGDEARVRFIRRDRFRDPGGNMVTKESPVIEKRVVRTPGGPRLAPVR